MSIHIYTFNQVYYLFLSKYIYIYVLLIWLQKKKKCIAYMTYLKIYHYMAS